MPRSPRPAAASRPTLKAVAAAANCSPAVASVCLNQAKGNIGVSPQVRQRVLAAARALDYRPNFAGRCLVQRRTRTWGVHFGLRSGQRPSNPYHLRLLEGLALAAREEGQDLLIIDAGDAPPGEVCRRKWREGRLDGLILIDREEAEPWAELLADPEVPLVALAGEDPGADFSWVRFDNRVAVRLGLAHLRELGHRRIGFVGSCAPVERYDTACRREAFGELCTQLGGECRPEWRFDSARIGRTVPPELGYLTCDLEGEWAADYYAALPAGERPTALLTYNDTVAAMMLRRLQVLGLAVPRDFSLLGVDDSPLCRFLVPRLTSLRQPLEAMGAAAGRRLLARCRGESGERVQTLAPELMARESTAKYSSL